MTCNLTNYKVVEDQKHEKEVDLNLGIKLSL